MPPQVAVAHSCHVREVARVALREGILAIGPTGIQAGRDTSLFVVQVQAGVVFPLLPVRHVVAYLSSHIVIAALRDDVEYAVIPSGVIFRSRRGNHFHLHHV